MDSVTTHGALAEGFERALRKCPERLREAFFRFGDRAVTLRCVGEQLLERVVPPFRHLLQSGAREDRPGLRIDVWDGGETGVDCRDARNDRATIEYDGSADGRYVGVWRPDMIGVLDRHARHIVAFAGSGDALSNFQLAKPFLFTLAVWYNDEGLQTLHAGLLARRERGALIVGPGGAGKSTVSLACFRAGFHYLGDDQIAIERTTEGFNGHSLFGSMLLDGGFGAAFEEVRDHGISGQKQVFGVAGTSKTIEIQEKTILQVAEIFPDRMRTSVPIAAIVISDFQPGRGETTWVRASRPEAFMALVPGTLENPSSAYPGCLPIITQLIERTPCYRLQAGARLADIARCLDEILEGTPA